MEIKIVKSKTEVCKSDQKVCPFPSQVTIIFIARAMSDRESYCVLVKPFKDFLCSHISPNHQSEKLLYSDLNISIHVQSFKTLLMLCPCSSGHVFLSRRAVSPVSSYNCPVLVLS